MTVRFDERQAKSFPEKVRDLDCFLSEAIATAGTFPHLSHKFGSAIDTMRDSMRIGGRYDIRGSNHHKRGSEDLGYDNQHQQKK